VRLPGSDRLNGRAEGGDTVFTGEVKRGKGSNALRGLKGATKKRPAHGGMTFVIRVSEKPEVLGDLSLASGRR